MMDYNKMSDRILETIKGVKDDEIGKKTPEALPGTKLAVACLINHIKYQKHAVGPINAEEATKTGILNTYKNLNAKLTGAGRVKKAPDECLLGILISLSKIKFIFIDEVATSDCDIDEKTKLIEEINSII